MVGTTFKGSKLSPWIAAGSITTEQTALAATGRSTATADALSDTVKITLRDPGAYGLLFRFRSDGSNNVDSVLQLYAARGTDDYHRVAQLTAVQGQQLDSGSIYFVDTITPASEDALFDGEESNLTDMIAHYYMRTLGFNKFLFLCSDLDTSTIYIDYAVLGE